MSTPTTVRILLASNISLLVDDLFQQDSTLVVSYTALLCDWYARVAASFGDRVYHYRDRNSEGNYTSLRHNVLVTTPDSLSYIRRVPTTFGAVIVDTIDEVLIKTLADSPLDTRQRKAVLSLLRSSMAAADSIFLVVSSVALVPLARLAASMLAPANAEVIELMSPPTTLAPLVVLDNDAAVRARLESAVRALAPTADRPLGRPLLIYSPLCVSATLALPLEEDVRRWLAIRSRLTAPDIEQPDVCTVLSLHPTYSERRDERFNREFARDPRACIELYRVAVVIYGPCVRVRFDPRMFGEAFVLLAEYGGEAETARRVLLECRLAAEERCFAVEARVAAAEAAPAPRVVDVGGEPLDFFLEAGVSILIRCQPLFRCFFLNRGSIFCFRLIACVFVVFF